ncbi:MAG: hypothetical protein RLZZ502_600 [Pseudomonadota bacterium]|jgi:Xaa-Pro aminopeptidase
MTAFTPQPYQARRARLLPKLDNAVAVLATSHEAVRNRDAYYSYRHDSYFYYLTGFTEPEAVLVLLGKTKDSPAKSILFCRDKDEEREIWDGFRHGPAAAREVFALDECYSISELLSKLPDYLQDRDALYTPVGLTGLASTWDKLIADALNTVRGRARLGVAAPSNVVDLRALLDPMRLQKDAHEIGLMRRAAEISSRAHVRAMQQCQPGMHEYQIEAELMHEFLSHGALSPAYGSIVASGGNSCCLHYRDNNRLMQDGDMLLIDAGGEYQSYASDITRTFPVNGRFSGAQRAVYEVVLAANKACMQQLTPGNAFNAYHDEAIKVIAQGLIDLKLCQGSVDSVIESKAYFQFYMHRAGHWLGLDVHDAGDYRKQGVWQSLQEGMVLTNEPGLYFRPADNVPEAFWNIGVRIEDDVLITASGNENLTASCPKEVAEIEQLMRR